MIPLQGTVVDLPVLGLHYASLYDLSFAVSAAAAAVL